MPPVMPSRILRGCGLMGRIMGAACERIKRGAVSRYSGAGWRDGPAQSTLGHPRTADVDTPMAAARAPAGKAARARAEHPDRGRVARDSPAHRRARAQRTRFPPAAPVAL